MLQWYLCCLTLSPYSFMSLVIRHMALYAVVIRMLSYIISLQLYVSGAWTQGSIRCSDTYAVLHYLPTALCLWCFDTGLYTLQWYICCLTLSPYSSMSLVLGHRALYAAGIRMMYYYYIFLALSLVLGHRALYAAVICMLSYTISLQLYVSDAWTQGSIRCSDKCDVLLYLPTALCLWCFDTGLYTLQWYICCLTLSPYSSMSLVLGHRALYAAVIRLMYYYIFLSLSLVLGHKRWSCSGPP